MDAECNPTYGRHLRPPHQVEDETGKISNSTIRRKHQTKIKKNST